MAWNLSARYVNSLIGDPTFGIGATTFLIFDETNAVRFYKYSVMAETLTQVNIGQYTSYGNTFDPADRLCMHNGQLFAAHITDYGGGGGTGCLQVFRINKNTGTPVLVLDTWAPYHCNKIYTHFQLSGIDTYASQVTAVELCSWGGVLYAAISMAMVPQAAWFPYAFPPPPTYWWDTTNHCTAVLQTGNMGGDWVSAYDVPPGGAAPADDLFAIKALVGHESQVMAGFERAAGADVALFGSPSWHKHQDVNIVDWPKRGFKNKFWRRSMDDLYYATNDFTNWTFYADYDLEPVPPRYPWATNKNGDPIVVDNQWGTVQVYYGTVLDGTIAADPDGGNYEGCLTYHGDYVTIAHNDPFSGNDVLDVYKREPPTKIGAIPTGLDIDATDGTLYATGKTAYGHCPFLVAVDTITIASGICASGVVASGVSYVGGGSGWVYPHAVGVGECHLYGLIGPNLKAVTYSGEYFADGILLGLPEPCYVGALRSLSLLYNSLHFAIVYSGAAPTGTLGISNDAGATFSLIKATPFPAQSMLRTYLSEPGIVGSGAFTFVGASGGHACPIQAVIDLGPWDNRCVNLPKNVTITDMVREI